jgi:hypothetical protein
MLKVATPLNYVLNVLFVSNLYNIVACTPAARRDIRVKKSSSNYLIYDYQETQVYWFYLKFQNKKLERY